MEGYMIDVVIGFSCGLFIGALFGFALACAMVAAGRDKRKDE